MQNKPTTLLSQPFMDLGDRDHVCSQNPGPTVTFLVNFTNINLETAHHPGQHFRHLVYEALLKYRAKTHEIDMILSYTV